MRYNGVENVHTVFLCCVCIVITDGVDMMIRLLFLHAKGSTDELNNSLSRNSSNLVVYTVHTTLLGTCRHYQIPGSSAPDGTAMLQRSQCSSGAYTVT